MRGSSSSSRTAVIVGVALLVAVVVGLRWRLATLTGPPRRTSATAPAATVAASPGLASLDDAERADGPADAGSDAASADGDPLGGFDNPPEAWATVDMDAIRAALPNNVYWKMAVPTKDPDVLRAREQERERWNTEYGKILSSTATDDEIDAYYAERQHLSEDYLEFIVYLLTNYGYQIPRRDVAALKLAAEMHHARLEEIPRKIAEAHERHQAHDAARRAWLEQQKAFAEDDGAAAPPARAGE